MSWEAVAAVATGVGAVVAAVSAMVVAWQAVETRRAARAAVNSVALGRSALVVSQTATVEATKTRLDARAPRLRITPKDVVAEDVWVSRGDGWAKWDDFKEVLRRTRDDAVLIRISADFEIVNEGNASVYVHYVKRRLNVGEDTESLAADAWRPSLAPGEKVTQRLQGVATLERWSAAWSGKNSDKSPLRVFATVVCSDLYDDGVVDKWSLELVGRPIEAVPDDLSAWRVRSVWDTPDYIEARAKHQERTYFASKSRQQKLAAPEVVVEIESAESGSSIQGDLTDARLPRDDPPF